MKSWPSHQFLKKKNIHKDYLGRCAVGQPDDACLCLIQEQLELPIRSCMKDLEVLLRTMLQLGFEMGVALTLSHDDFFALSHLLWHSQPASNRPCSVWFEMVVALTLSHGDFQRTFTPACAVTACFTTPMQSVCDLFVPTSITVHFSAVCTCDRLSTITAQKCNELDLQLCRTFYEGIVPFKPTAYGLHNILKRNDLLVARAKVSGWPPGLCLSCPFCAGCLFWFASYCHSPLSVAKWHL